MIFTSGLASLITSAMPAHSPPPPTGTTTCARSGTSSSSSRPSEPWPATIAGSSNGWTNASPPSSARSSAETRHASTLLPPTWTIAPCAARGLDLRHRRVGGHEDLAADAAGGRGRRRAPARGCRRWRRRRRCAQPSSPSAASFAATPRTLNEPVRCRFSAFSDDRPTRTLGERAGGQDRRAARDGLDRRACGLDVARGDAHSAMIASISTSAPIGRAATPIVVRAGGSARSSSRTPRSSRRRR